MDMTVLIKDDFIPYDPETLSDKGLPRVMTLKDEVNGTTPLFVYATTVYLTYDDYILLMKPTKDNKVMDYLCGIGGKLQLEIPNGEGYETCDEKVPIDSIYQHFSKNSSNNLSPRGRLKEIPIDAVTREVREEAFGFEIKKENLNKIGTSEVRIIDETKTECWHIDNYKYELTYNEFLTLVHLNLNNNGEGLLEWYNINELDCNNLSPQDRLILLGGTKDAFEIRDNVNNINVVYTTSNSEENPGKYISKQNERYIVGYISKELQALLLNGLPKSTKNKN